MAVDTTTRIGLLHEHPLPLTRRITAVRSAPIVLSLIVVVSTAARTLGALRHPAPTLFPDEYIYTALARSFGSSGLPLIRGEIAHFPSLLAPIAAAPIWALAPTMVAYRLVQVENALFMSLAAIPVYLLARRLGFGSRYSLACALFAVVIPDLAYSARTLSGPIAYPLALAAVYAAQVALERPTRRTQVAFLAIAGLATLARVQYVLLYLAYFGALGVTHRRDAHRTHRLSIVALLGAVTAALALGASRTLGYYSAVLHLHVGVATVRWIGTDLFLLAVAAGIVLVPGAVVGLATARGRRDATFATLVVFLTVTLLIAAGLYASNGSDRFQERYLVSLLPLVPLAFGLYLRNGRPARLAVIVVSALLVIIAVRVPLSGYAVGTGSTDSPLLWAVVRLNALIGTGSSSLLIAVYITCAAFLAVLVAFGLRTRIVFLLCLVVLGLASVAATSADARTARLVKAQYVSPDPTWVDDARVGDVTAIATGPSPEGFLTEQLFWNRSITREVLLGGADPTDAFATSEVRVTADGSLETPSGPIRAPILFENYAVTATLEDAERVASTASFTLWKPASVARLGMLQTGRYQDGWLAPRGSLALWPRPGRRLHGVLSFTVWLPPTLKPIELTVGGRTATLSPGASRRFSFCVDAPGEWKVSFRGGASALPDFRIVSARETIPRFSPGASCESGRRS